MTTHKHDTHHHHHHDSDSFQSLLKSLLLLGLGVYFSYNIVSGNLSNYINARFAWLSYLAAGLFFALAAFAFWSWWQGRRDTHDHTHDHHHHHHDHDHTHDSSWFAIVIVALPLVFGTLIPSEPLGADAISGDVRISAVNVSTTTTLSSDPLERNILDWLRQFNFSNDLDSFNGQEASVIGFIYREPNFPEGHLMVARFAVSCCVADSTAMGLPINTNGLSVDEIADGEWVRVGGTFTVGEFQEQTIPILQLETVEIVEQPAQPYLNP